MFGGCTVALGAMTLVNVIAVTAQNLSFRANNFYRSKSIQIQPIKFPTQYHTNISRNLFYPRNLSQSSKTPAIIISHPIGAIKKQSANLYTTKLTEQGFITISINLPY
ncbi:hypothetical protein H9Q69_003579 [Fusarium xylarioides]|nr:hypothetical protein H9Q69_003579 [Fusarium xylarioides]KAG5808266.1 hypothetical protein H9Q71_007206 [Fusarium xylarioides]KAG5827126.1 hypothetical protein H9Q74_002782 [Fusarium xylarioides]